MKKERCLRCRTSLFFVCTLPKDTVAFRTQPLQMVASFREKQLKFMDKQPKTGNSSNTQNRELHFVTLTEKSEKWVKMGVCPFCLFTIYPH